MQPLESTNVRKWCSVLWLIPCLRRSWWHGFVCRRSCLGPGYTSPWQTSLYKHTQIKNRSFKKSITFLRQRPLLRLNSFKSSVSVVNQNTQHHFSFLCVFCEVFSVVANFSQVNYEHVRSLNIILLFQFRNFLIFMLFTFPRLRKMCN